MTLALRVYALDGNQATVGVVDAYTEFALVLVYNGVGSWSITVPLSTAQSTLWSIGGAIAVHAVDASGNDLQPALLSGPVTDLRTTESDAENTIVVTGVSDDTYLYDRLIDPTLIIASLTADVSSGPAETIVKYYAGTYLRPGDVVVEPDAGRGTATSYSAAYQPIGLVASVVAEIGAIGWQIRSTVDPVAGRTRRLTVRVPSTVPLATFSRALGSISSATYELSAATANRVIMRGPAGYTYYSDPVAQAATRRIIETFGDDSTQSSPTQIALDGAQLLTDAASAGSLQIVAIDLPGQAFGTAYSLGDTVAAVVNGVTVTGRVRQVQINAAAGSPLAVVPVIGNYGAESTDLPSLVPLVKSLAAKLAAFERNG